MKKSIYAISFLIIFTNSLNARLPFSNSITFFIQESPLEGKDSSSKFKEAAQKPGKLAYKIASAMMAPKNQGIFVTYGGYLVISNLDGLVTFPRMQQSTDFTLIITEKIEPVLMIGNTIHHWQLLNIPVDVYSITREQDATTQLYYWNVQPTQKPENNMIPLTSITIFAKPSSVIVPTGISITNDNPQLILPTFYTTKNINRLAPSLEILNVRQFFGPLTITNKKENDLYYSTQMIHSQ